MRENAYQAHLIKEIKRRLPDSFVMKNDANYLQGILDLLVLNNDRWGMLEVKVAEDAPHRPNQDYYVEKFQGMSFAAFIYPENEEQVLNDLQQALRAPRRNSRVPKR